MIANVAGDFEFEPHFESIDSIVVAPFSASRNSLNSEVTEMLLLPVF